MSDWYEDVVNEAMQQLSDSEKNDIWFSLMAISNVPYIAYPDFTEEECLEVQEQAQNVLRLSRSENQYKEVAITYNLNDMTTEAIQNTKNFFEHKKVKSEKYLKVLGDETSVLIMNDENTAKLIKNANAANELVIVSIHNHPDNSAFSVNDLLVFSLNSSIKLMEIVNKRGEISALYRPKEIDLSNIVLQKIVSVPNFRERKEKQYYDGNFNLLEVLTKEEKINIIKESLYEFELEGCVYFDYVNQEKADLLNLDELIEDEEIQEECGYDEI